MHSPSQKNKKQPLKVIRMKTVKGTKKPVEPVKEKDYVSETISFVIKGKLTPIKPTFVTKKIGVAGKKITAKKPAVVKKAEIIKKQKLATPVVVKKVVKKKLKTPETKPIKAATRKQPTPRTPKKSESQDDIKNDKKVKLSPVVKPKKQKAEVVTKKHAAVKTPKETKRKPLKKTDGENDKVKKVTKDEQAAKNADDIKTKQTIEKLLKQANRALKNPQPGRKKNLKKQKKQVESLAESVTKKDQVIKEEVTDARPKEIKGDGKELKKTKPVKRKNIERKIAVETLPVEKTTVVDEPPQVKKSKIKKEIEDSPEEAEVNQTKQPVKKKKNVPKSNVVLMKKRVMKAVKDKIKCKENQRARKLKLFGFWNGPKRHRVASLNALAKVHCLYENETRGNLLDSIIDVPDKQNVKVENKVEDVEEVTPCTRTLRSVPGLRAVGKHWDMHDTTSSSDDNSGYESAGDVEVKPQKAKVKKEPQSKKAEQEPSKKKPPETKRKRNRTELIMDLKDMVVRKRMASLNASAILAASYSVEKRPTRSPKSSETPDSSDYFVTDNEEEPVDTKKDFDDNSVKTEEDGKLIEVCASPNKKMAVILNQDTDVTITGVYVNSTTRSTHHEGYCSIAGMQYRISATSHTQTAATAVATETLLQSSSSSTQENSNSESLTSCKSYTPLDALSNMQPPPGPGVQHSVPHQHMGPPQHVLPLPQHQLSPGRRHGCPSAFSAPHAAPPYPHAAGHHHPPPPPLPGDPGYVHGYYQPAGPLINVPHGHTQPPPITKSAPLSEASPSSAPSPIHQQQQQQQHQQQQQQQQQQQHQPQHQQQPPPPPPAPSSNGGDSSDSEVIITSVTAGTKETVPPSQQPPPSSSYRYTQYPGAPPGYSYSYPPHYYPTPPPAPSYAHHDLCYPNPYLHHKYPPTTYRRYLPSAQYYTPNPPDIYTTPPSGPPQQSQQVVTATPVSASGSSYQAPPNGPPPTLMEPYPPPPPPTLVETFPHPPHYYPGYGPTPPPPSCYTHSPPTRTIPPYINATYQTCPCPMQSCPKNVLTGPLTGDSKRSNITKDSMPLPPVALALPLEPASATGPPSPARGSAGMPPPPSPAGATYQPPPPAPKQESQSPESAAVECHPVEKKRKARVGKAMVRNNIAAIQQNTMLLMCNPNNQRSFPGEVKREIESPKGKDAEMEKRELCSDDEMIKSSSTVPVAVEPEVVERIVGEAQNLKREEHHQETAIAKEVQEQESASMVVQQVVELEPIVSTVAENVKVKNMKRKLSLAKDNNNKRAEPEVDSPAPKKPKVEKYGSYKDLIKKDTTTIKINNGKRKLINEDPNDVDDDEQADDEDDGDGAAAVANKTKVPRKQQQQQTKKAPTKRKLSQTREEDTPVVNNKRLKPNTKPLTASNLQNSKQQYSKMDKILNEPLLSENKEPHRKVGKSNINNNSKLPVNSKTVGVKKLAPAILDSLIAKNSIDRTIESVVSDAKVLVRTKDKCAKSKEPVTTTTTAVVAKKSTNKNGQIKNNFSSSSTGSAKVECQKSVGANRRKSKGKDAIAQVISKVPRRSLQQPRWSNGWRWEGDAFESKVFLNSDETTVVRKCYPAMRHEAGDIIETRDCVLLKAGPRKNDLPFVAKIAFLWENPDDGEMMMSLLWYYRPEHTEQGRLPADQPDEVFASRHKDSNSVACIDDKCYVLTFLEYCRYRKNLKRLEEGLEESSLCIPIPEPYPRFNRQPPFPLQVSPDMVFFCRRVYDFRQKRIVKNPS